MWESPESYSQPKADWQGNCSFRIKLRLRNSAASIASSIARISIIRSMKYAASVTRNEQR